MPRRDVVSEARELLARRANGSVASSETAQPSERADKPDDDAYDDSSPTASPPALLPAALYGPIGDWVRLIAPHTEACEPALLVSAVVAIGALVGRTPSVTLDGARHGINLFALLIGPTSGGRKGTAVAWVRRLLKALDPDFEKRNVKGGGLSSGQGIKHAVRDANSAKNDVGVSDKRLLVLEAEFSAVLKQMRGEGNTLSAVLREAWDGHSLSNVTKLDPLTATDPHICVVGQITPDELRKRLEDGEILNGFLNRFLPCWSERSRLLPFGGEPDHGDEREAVLILSRAVTNARTIASVGHTATACEWYTAHYLGLTSGRRGKFGAATQRAAPQVWRLALLFTVLDGARQVDTAHFEAAYALWQYCEGTARYLFGGADLSENARNIEAALIEAGPLGLTRTTIRANVIRSNNISRDKIDSYLAELRDAGRARMLPPQKGVGRSAEVWVHTQFLGNAGASDRRNGRNGRKGDDEPVVTSHSSHFSQAPNEEPEVRPVPDGLEESDEIGSAL